MSIWFLLQIVINLFVIMGVAVCLVRAFREPKDDPRLTQGLRLLQSKISILEDLSDHTENQVKQLMTLLDKKLHEVRGTIDQVKNHIGEVDRSIQKSKKMALQIQNEIPHDQIVKQKLENKYIQAAQLAHRGRTVDEIVNALGLPKAEVELIAKINKKKCVYESTEKSVEDQLFAKSLEMPVFSNTSTDQVEVGFKQAIQDHQERSEFQSIKLG